MSERKGFEEMNKREKIKLEKAISRTVSDLLNNATLQEDITKEAVLTAFNQLSDIDKEYIQQYVKPYYADICKENNIKMKQYNENNPINIFVYSYICGVFSVFYKNSEDFDNSDFDAYYGI